MQTNNLIGVECTDLTNYLTDSGTKTYTAYVPCNNLSYILPMPVTVNQGDSVAVIQFVEVYCKGAPSSFIVAGTVEEFQENYPCFFE